MTGNSEVENLEPAIRFADRRDVPQIMNVLDGSLLDVAAERVRGCIDAGSVLVAGNGKLPLGALVLSGSEIEAVAVRRRHRNRGIGTALVERARRETNGPLVAEFDPRVRPFYASLGFVIGPTDDGRLRGRDTPG